MAEPQSKKNPWDLDSMMKMLNLSGDQTNPAVMSQMAQQAQPPSPQDMAPQMSMGAPPQEQMGGMSMPPGPPKPQVVSPPPQKVKLTAQPTSQKIGELPQEIPPTQKTFMTRDELIAGLKPPDDSAMLREMKLGEATYAASQNLQQGEVQKLKDQLAKFQGEPQRKDYRPIAAAFDSWFGSKLSGAAEAGAPMSPEKRAALMAEMQQAIVASQGQLTSSQQEALKNKLAQMGYMSERQMKADIAKITAMGQSGAASSRERRANTQEARLASQAVKDIHQDKMIVDAEQQMNRMNIDKHTLNAPGAVNPQMLAEIQTGIANVISGGRTASVHAQQTLEMKNLATEYAQFMQKISSGVVDVDAPEMKEYLGSIIDRLNEGYANIAYARAKQKLEGAETAYGHVPIAYDAMSEAAESYNPSTKKSWAYEGEGAGEDDKAAMEWAEANPTDPRATKIKQLHGAK